MILRISPDIQMHPPRKNSVALLTGASSGIGREMARELAPYCRVLILVARRRERLEELRQELNLAHPALRVEVFPCDLTRLDDISRMLEQVENEIGDVDLLINNAGMGDIAFLDSADWKKLEQMLQLNVSALTYLTHRLVKGMVRRGRGGILNVSSGFGYTFLPGFATYVGTKHFVTGFSDTLRTELAGSGVVVTQVAPGPVATEFIEVATEQEGALAPDLVSISARKCARQAIRAFMRGRAVVTPGLLPRLLILLGRATPRFLLRLIGTLMAGPFRRRIGRLALAGWIGLSLAAPLHASQTPAPRPADEAAVREDLRLILARAGLPESAIRLSRKRITAAGNSVHIRCDFRSDTVNIAVHASAGEWAPTFYHGLQKLGFLFPHPEVQISPDPGHLRASCGKSYEWKPRFRFRGFHLHTMHPNEWVAGFLMGEAGIAESTVRWHARNGQNLLQLVLLRTASLEHVKAPLMLARRLGVLTGVAASFAQRQQRSYRLINLPEGKSGLDEELEALRESLNRVTASLPLDFMTLHMGTSEFTSTDFDRTLSWIEEARIVLASRGVKIFISIHVSTGQTHEKYGNFNFLPQYSHPDVGVLPHTVMFYGLSDRHAPVYGRENFDDMKEFMLQENAVRPTWYHPETSYFIAMDLDVPLLQTDYLRARSKDMDLAEEHGIEGHLTFTSGQELGYWLMDWTVALLNNSENRGDPLAAVRLLGEDAGTWQRILDFQTRHFKERQLIALLSSATLLDELPFIGESVHERVILRELKGRRQVIHEQLAALDTALAELPTLEGVRSLELRLLLEVTWARIEHARLLREALLHSSWSSARHAVLDRARQVRKRTLAQLEILTPLIHRYPDAHVFEKIENPTSYLHGYGWTAARLHFWEREELMIRRNFYNPFFMNIYDPTRILF